jgi:hypothetical protein
MTSRVVGTVHNNDNNDNDNNNNDNDNNNNNNNKNNKDFSPARIVNNNGQVTKRPRKKNDAGGRALNRANETSSPTSAATSVLDFAASTDKILTVRHRRELAELGYTVIEKFLDSDTCRTAVEEFARVLSVFGPCPFRLHSGMIQYLGHTRPQWQMRHACTDIFRELWGCAGGEMATSFDGFCYMDGDRKNQRTPIDAFLHRDQNLKSTNLMTIQGLVNLTDNTHVESGGFVCVPGTHTIADFGEIFVDTNMEALPADQWHPFSAKEKTQLGASAQFVSLGVGDVLLWDSRLAHCNTKCYSPGRLRVVSYVCMKPKACVVASSAAARVFAKRLRAAKEKRCARHFPLDNFKMFAKIPRHTSKDFCKQLELANSMYELTDQDYSLV